MQNASYEHYVKVVGSKFFFSNGEAVDTYTYTTNSHQYQDNATMAAAKFTYDLSPMSIVVTETREPAADACVMARSRTNCCWPMRIQGHSSRLATHGKRWGRRLG